MSLYQCEHCGCCENTALGAVSHRSFERLFSFDGIEERRGNLLCSACGPTKYRSGTPTGYGQWHGEFDRVFLPKGQFKTNQRGNLEHIETGSEDFRAYALSAQQAKERT